MLHFKKTLIVNCTGFTLAEGFEKFRPEAPKPEPEIPMDHTGDVLWNGIYRIPRRQPVFLGHHLLEQHLLDQHVLLNQQAFESQHTEGEQLNDIQCPDEKRRRLEEGKSSGVDPFDPRNRDVARALGLEVADALVVAKQDAPSNQAEDEDDSQEEKPDCAIL